MAGWQQRLKNEVHRWVDPILARRDYREHYADLKTLTDGEYQVPFEVPYIPQFASTDLINDYIHHGYDGKNDPNWASFGADKPEDYAFWSHRVCALACLKMAIGAFQTVHPAPTLWELVQRGLEHQGYVVHDEHGNWKDEGWYVQAQVKLAADYKLTMRGYSYAAPLGMCRHIQEKKLVAAAVTPELGERHALSRRYGGHLVIVLGFRWQNRQPSHYLVHNPSGRYPELQAHAWIPAHRFRRSFAYRYATFEPHTAH